MFRSNLGDFAVCQAREPSFAIAFLSVIRPSHRALRIGGHLGQVVLPSGADPAERKVTIASASVTHLADVPDLSAASFLPADGLDQER
jgi:hypothetical protein